MEERGLTETEEKKVSEKEKKELFFGGSFGSIYVVIYYASKRLLRSLSG